MTTLATTSSLRDALTPEALTRARRRLLTAHPDPTRANTPRREASPTNNSASSPRATGCRHGSPL